MKVNKKLEEQIKELVGRGALFIANNSGGKDGQAIPIKISTQYNQKLYSDLVALEKKVGKTMFAKKV